MCGSFRRELRHSYPGAADPGRRQSGAEPPPAAKPMGRLRRNRSARRAPCAWRRRPGDRGRGERCRKRLAPRHEVGERHRSARGAKHGFENKRVAPISACHPDIVAGRRDQPSPVLRFAEQRRKARPLSNRGWHSQSIEPPRPISARVLAVADDGIVLNSVGHEAPEHEIGSASTTAAAAEFP